MGNFETVGRVLIVDDNLMIRRNHCLFMKKKGFEVFEAVNGLDALKKLESCESDFFSLIILDIVMPEMSGPEFIDKAKELCGGTLPPIIVCSSVSDVPFIKTLVKKGIASYIIKPIDYKAFGKKLKDVFPETG